MNGLSPGKELGQQDILSEDQQATHRQTDGSRNRSQYGINPLPATGSLESKRADQSDGGVRSQQTDQEENEDRDAGGSATGVGCPEEDQDLSGGFGADAVEHANSDCAGGCVIGERVFVQAVSMTVTMGRHTHAGRGLRR